jgi:hypothetical protein
MHDLSECVPLPIIIILPFFPFPLFSFRPVHIDVQMGRAQRVGQGTALLSMAQAWHGHICNEQC